MADVIVCAGVSIRYERDAPPVLSGLSFVLREGERVAVIGRNGSGKTTLLAALVGLVAHEGEISIAGVRLERASLARIRDRVGFLFNVPEDQLLFPKVIEDVAFGLLRRGCGRPEAFARARAALADLGAEDLAELPLHHLSHGQKQRVALAGALVTSPELLLLDEPTAGLDPPGRREIAALLAGLPAPQLIATHDLDLADRLCSRVLLLEGGRVGGEYPDTSAVRRSWLGR